MPATSKAQQQAAGIAHAVEKGELPKSKLKGASKQMYKGMAGKGELHKFAATKTKDLPKHVSDGVERVANLFGRTLLGEGAHKPGCQCGFCKNKGSFGKKKEADKEPDEPKEPEVTEAKAPGEVKLSKGVNLGGPAARAYHGMTSKQAMTPEWKPKAYVKAAGEVAGLNKTGQVQGFKNKLAGETTSGKKLPKTRPGESKEPSDTAKAVVAALLD